MTGFQVPRCECGHTPADHASSGPSLYARPRGRCMAPGCDCKQFRETEEENAA